LCKKTGLDGKRNLVPEEGSRRRPGGGKTHLTEKSSKPQRPGNTRGTKWWEEKRESTPSKTGRVKVGKQLNTKNEKRSAGNDQGHLVNEKTLPDPWAAKNKGGGRLLCAEKKKEVKLRRGESPGQRKGENQRGRTQWERGEE